MIPAKITIRNYRSIPYNNPITIEIAEGITFILGVNNVGKSNLLKFFYELRQTMSNEGGLDGIRNLPDEILYSNIKNQQSGKDEIEITITGERRSFAITLRPYNSRFMDDTEYKQKFAWRSNNDDFPPDEFFLCDELFRNSLYIGSFRSAFSQTSGYYFDILNGETFVKKWNEWAKGVSSINRNKVIELKKELKELFGFNQFEISSSNQGNSLIVETDNGSFRLDELGGGISHFILVLGNALFRQPSFILIDEPESGLHPKLQVEFLRILASKAKYGVVATSHSIGLARSVGADRIYSLSRDLSGGLTLTNFGNEYKPSIRDAIDELGYSQFAELGGNNILLVEGTTDILSFREILRKYGIEQHFIIMSLGGSNLISSDRRQELEELKRLHAKSYNIIFDSELSHENDKLKDKFESFKSMAESLSYNVFPTDYHSTENYITQEALDKVHGNNQFTSLTKFEVFADRPKEKKWGKSLNWKCFHVMSKSDFEGTGLHRFIVETLAPKCQ